MRARIQNLSLPGRARRFGVSSRVSVFSALVVVGLGLAAASVAFAQPCGAMGRGGLFDASVGSGAVAQGVTASGLPGGAGGVATGLAFVPPSTGSKAGLVPVSCLVLVGATGAPASGAPAPGDGNHGYFRQSSSTLGATVGFAIGMTWLVVKGDSRGSLAGVKYEAVPVMTIGLGAVVGWTLGALLP